MQGQLDDKCPNCGLVEKAEHLNVCPSESRTKLPEEGVELLEQWLGQDACTNSELAYWIPKYILFQGQHLMASLGPMLASMLQAAQSQDLIGWPEFGRARF